MPCLPHCWGSAITVAATVQLLALLPNPTSSPCAEIPMLEYDTTENPLRTDLLVEPLLVVDGVIQLPSGSGLGVKVDERALARYRVA